MVFTEDSKRGNRPSGLIQPVSTCARNLTGGTSIGDSVSIQRRYVEAAGLMVGMQCRICENKMLPQKNIKVWVVILWAIFFWPGAIIYILTKQPDTCPFCKAEVYKVGM